MAKTAGSFFRDKDVILKADAAKVIVLFQLGVVHEVLAKAFLLELFDECRDEVDAGFVGNHVAGFQAAGHSQGAQAQLFGAGLVRVVTYQILAQE